MRPFSLYFETKELEKLMIFNIDGILKKISYILAAPFFYDVKTKYALFRFPLLRAKKN